ncbi:hypothetical protein VTO73DRAFT_13544 [Trametes versicolor]
MRRARLVLTVSDSRHCPALPPGCPVPPLASPQRTAPVPARRRTPLSPSEYVSHHRSVLHTRYVHAGGRSEQEQNTATDPSYGALQQQRRSKLAS